MTVANQNAKIYKGNTAALTVAVTQADGTPYDPTLNAEIRYRVAKSRYSDEVDCIVRKSLSDGGIADGGGGNIVIDLETVDTDLEPGVYYHELRVWDGGDVATAMTGAFVVKPALSMVSDNQLSPPRTLITISGSVPFSP